MSKTVKWMLCAAMAAAAAVAVLLGTGFFRDRRALSGMRSELAVSRAAWEDTAARKEALQAELKVVTEDLKEARLTLEESETRAEELRADISQLEEEIAALKQADP